jgi:hypothetical protein
VESTSTAIPQLVLAGRGGALSEGVPRVVR